MNSIRPLATITLLAVAGVFLYFKLNEMEPILPEDVADWNLSESVEIGGQLGGGKPHAFSTPSFAETPAVSAAPSFQAAPPFDSASAAATANSVASVAGSSMPSLPDLPPLPAVPAMTTPVASNDASLASTDTTPPPAASPQVSLFAATRLAVQAALDRGELSQALLLLSDWYGDPSLAPAEKLEVDTLLSQLAGSVVYSTEHRLEPPYLVQAGERLDEIAKQYNVPWQLLAKINGIDRPDAIQPGQKLKVVRGPFSALIDLSDRRMTLMLERRYAGKFAIDIDPQITVEEGYWTVDQKLITPGNVGLTTTGPTTPSEEQSLVLTNASHAGGQVAVLRGPGGAPSVGTEPAGRVIRLKQADVQELYDILSVGSRVIVRR